MFRLPWSLALSALVLGCNGNRSSPHPVDDELIYAAALDSVVHSGRMIVLADSGPFLRSQASAEVLRGIRPRLAVQLVPYAVVAYTHGEEGPDSAYWTRFEAKFPDADGWYSLSRIDHTDPDHAALAYSHLCGWECADGGKIELVRRGGGWIVTSVKLLWVA